MPRERIEKRKPKIALEMQILIGLRKMSKLPFY